MSTPSLGGSAPRWARAALVGGVLLISLALLGTGIWLLTLERAARAAARGNLERAAALYAAAEQPFVGPLAQVFPAAYGRTVLAQVALAYRRGKLDAAAALLDKAAAASPSLSEYAEFAFWRGNVLIRRALANEDPELIMKNLYAAGDQYRKALVAAPDDWDIKHNFELVQYVLRQQELDRQKEEARIKSILERIRTITEPGEREPPPPEKRG